ncbi:MAG TPA: ABC transporter permease [Vicinamibacterales bacterium]
MTRLPRSLERVLAWTVPREQREPIAGDLIEEHSLRLRGGGFAARPRAYAGLWWSALQLAGSFAWERLRRDRPLPPIAGESARRSSLWDMLAHDAAFGVRMLRRQPAFAAIAIAVLALGIGANTAMFGFVNAVLWRPLPFPRADRIVSLGEQRPHENRWFGPIAPADFFDWRRDSRSFSAMAASMVPPSGAFNLTGAGEPERVRAIQVTPAFLTVLGIVPALGRDFRPDEETDGRQRVALLSDGLWRRRFGADPAIVGRTVEFDSHTFEVIGVLPARFWWPTRPDAVVPLALTNHDRALRGAHFLEAVARVGDGVSIDQAREELRVLSARLSQDYPAVNSGHAANLRPLRDAFVGDVRQALLVLLGAVAFVLLIACANVATLQLARAAGRHKELSIRRAVGASRLRVVQQLMTESLVIALVGGAAGLLVAAGALALMRGVLPTQFAGLPGISAVGLDGRAVAAAFGFSTITALVFGIVPALASSDAGLAATLTEETRGSTASAAAQRWRAALVVTELALSLVLLSSAALLLVSFQRLINVPLGFQPAQLTTADLRLPGARYDEHARTVAFVDALFARVRVAPGVQHAAATTALPLVGGDSRLDLVIEHRAPSPGAVPMRADARLVSTDYFATLGIPLVRGRFFTEHDTESSAKVAILNAAAVRRYWPGEDPLGRRISLGADDDWRGVVGVVGDTHNEGLDVDAEPAAYLPQRQLFENLGSAFERTMTIVIRSSNDTAANASIIRSALSSVDPQLPTGPVRKMEEVIGDSIAPRRLNLVVVVALTFMALVLTGAGLYGVMSYIVAQRTREIGVRMALGASRRQVLGMMFGQALRVMAAGIGIGVAGALALTRSMSSLLFGVNAGDPLIYVAVSVLLAAVGLAAVAVPASRATRIDPLAALRN